MRRRAVVLASAASAVAILGGWQLGAASTATLVDGGAPLASTGGADASDASGTTGEASGSDASGSTEAPGGSASGGSASGGASAGSATEEAGATAGATAADAADGTYTGAAVSTRFGDVQVQVTIAGGAIADVTALQLTDHDGRSVSISNRAAPLLRDEVLQAQSTNVSMISGATYTSAAYLQSLQAALDEAGF
ncbi:FMN-binding protein [Agromyces sp. MMS24-K17]|uniref:FMN-binding protein n=1 Tax=Agromyces sp. MMS24-K17 TaxID=3372850 RepID=UPI0037549F14